MSTSRRIIIRCQCDPTLYSVKRLSKISKYSLQCRRRKDDYNETWKILGGVDRVVAGKPFKNEIADPRSCT